MDANEQRRQELELRRVQLSDALQHLGRRAREEKARHKQLYRAIRFLLDQRDDALKRGDTGRAQHLRMRLTELERQRDADQPGRILTEYNRVLHEKHQIEAELRRIGGGR